jgi:glutathione reductase (NADPH)
MLGMLHLNLALLNQLISCSCVPKKMTYNMAKINETLNHGGHYGYDIPKNIPFDFGAFVEKRDARIKALNGIYENNWQSDGVDLLKGKATFVSEHEIEIDMQDGGKARVTAPHITIATGGYPLKPKDIKGSEYGISSDDFFQMKVLPKRMVFVGAGYIAVELAGMMNTLGVETHMFLRHSTFLRKFDPMIQDTLTKRYEDAGVIIHKNHPGIKEVVQPEAAASESDPSSKRLKLIINDGSEFECNELLWAIGRAPELQDLNVQKIGLTLGKKGHILVDAYQNTNLEGIHAIGDVTGQAELTPVAIAAGRKLGDRLFGPPELKDSKLDYDRIPSVVFSEPNCGATGMTEPEAIEKYGKDQIKVYHTKFRAMFYDVFSEPQRSQNPTEYKVITMGKDQRIVGLHLIGDEVAEAMQAWGVVVKMGGKKSDLDACVAIHPTSAEELVTLK